MVTDFFRFSRFFQIQLDIGARERRARIRLSSIAFIFAHRSSFRMTFLTNHPQVHGDVQMSS